jgi:two-component system chemotaxis sensor kinase CheA
VIEIEDDGKGLSREFLMQKAISKGLIQEDAQMSDAEAFALIFAPGFSTAEVVSDISGRGVGMDVVKKNIEALKGNVELSSSVGKGSRFTIRLPLTLAIIEGFLFQVGSSYFIVPLNMIAEVLELDEKCQTQESRLFDLRGALLPLLDLREFYHQEERENISRQNVIVVRYANQSMGLVVDELFGENQTVVKSLGRLFKNAPAIYGASILGNAEIALIMDIPALFHLVNLDKESK